MASIVVIGAGPGGLATAMLLANSGIEVMVLDKDSSAPPDSALDAWDSWQRTGVAQFRQAHTLLARGRQILQTDLPKVHDHLEGLGAQPFDMLEPLPPTIPDWAPAPDDGRFTSLGARRPIYELAFALAAQKTAALEIRRGISVTGLIRGPEAIPGVPHVTGVITDTGDQIDADLVIDAGGRRSPLPRMLEKVGARPLFEESQDSRFAYYTRFYRRRDGESFPEPYVISLFPAGSISVLTLPGDNDTWSVTLYSTTADKQMRAVRDPQVFERVVAAIPARAGWIEGEPITEVDVMAGISDRERSLVVEGAPVTTGVMPVSDAWACTNPSLGRGITMALMHVAALIPDIVELLDQPVDLAEAWYATTEESVQPWHRATLELDRARNSEMDAIRAGETGPTDSSNIFNEQNPEESAFLAAMLQDQHMFRAGLEIAGLFSLPSEVMSRPEVREKLAALGDDMPDMPQPDIPTRDELESLLR